MARLVATLALVALAFSCVSAGSNTKYDEVAKVSFPVSLELKNFTADAFTTVSPTCKEDLMGATCLQAVQADTDNGAKLKVSWTIDITALPANVFTFKAVRCFSGSSKADRPWRKYKPVIDDDKQCVKIEENIPFVAGQSAYSIEKAVKDETPKSTYFVRVLVQCKDASGSIDYCAYSDWIGPNGDAAFFKVLGFKPVTASLRVGAIIMSILSWVFLIGYFVFEKMRKSD